jgi:hypothetical protein
MTCVLGRSPLPMFWGVDWRQGGTSPARYIGMGSFPHPGASTDAAKSGSLSDGGKGREAQAEHMDLILANPTFRPHSRKGNTT